MVEIKTIELYKDFNCDCGASNWNVFQSKKKISLVCKSCNLKLFIGFPVFERKQGAREELKRSHQETLKIIFDLTNKINANNVSLIVNVLGEAHKERLKELR